MAPAIQIFREAIMVRCAAMLLISATLLSSSAHAQSCSRAIDTPPRATLLAVLADPKVVKSDFETTDQYQARIAKSLNGVTELTLVSPFSSLLGRYSADQQLYEIPAYGLYGAFDALGPLAINSPGLNDWLAIDLKKLGGKARTYVGQNAYGAKRSVLAATATIYGVAFPAHKIRSGNRANADQNSS
jgi:hypothetical protein